MKAYLVLDFTVTDLPGFMPYVNQIPAHIARHGGRYIVRGVPPTPIEDDWKPDLMVILEFPARENADAFLAPRHDAQQAGAGRRLHLAAPVATRRRRVR